MTLIWTRLFKIFPASGYSLTKCGLGSTARKRTARKKLLERIRLLAIFGYGLRFAQIPNSFPRGGWAAGMEGPPSGL
jgi:hypothetical protein